MAKVARERPLLARCVLLCGNPIAGQLIYRLMIWKPSRSINGRLWFAKSHEELMSETALSLQQIKDSLKRLRALGFLKSEQHLFGGKNVNHYMLTPEFQLALKKAAWDTESGLPEPGQETPPEESPQTLPEEVEQALLEEAKILEAEEA